MTFDVYYINGEWFQFEDGYKFCKENEWASHLMYCDISEFAITESGDLVLTDDCGNVAYCPKGILKIIFHINGQDIEQIY